MLNLIVVLDDQLDPQSAALQDIDPKHDAVWMAESSAEATHVWSHKARIALFLEAMRHFRDELRARGITVHYREMSGARDPGLLGLLEADLASLDPRKVILVEPGEWRLREAFRELAARLAGRCPVALREDTHFLYLNAEFAAWMRGRRQPRMEHFYRQMRRKHGILVDADGKPRGEQWNFDHDNRASFGRAGPPAQMPAHRAFAPDDVTREVLDLVERQFPEHPGSLAHFDWL